MRRADLGAEAMVELAELARSLDQWIQEANDAPTADLDAIAQTWSKARLYMVGMARTLPAEHPARWILAPRSRGNVIVT